MEGLTNQASLYSDSPQSVNACIVLHSTANIPTSQPTTGLPDISDRSKFTNRMLGWVNNTAVSESPTSHKVHI